MSAIGPSEGGAAAIDPPPFASSLLNVTRILPGIAILAPPRDVGCRGTGAVAEAIGPHMS